VTLKVHDDEGLYLIGVIEAARPRVVLKEVVIASVVLILVQYALPVIFDILECPE